MLYQCKACQKLFLDEQEVLTHTRDAHLDRFFEMKEIEGEEPKGHFVCVARCSLSGTLLGPPNYHGYKEKIREIWRPTLPADGIGAIPE